MGPRGFGLLSCFVFVLGWLLAAKFWEQKPYTEWTENETEKILNDSPWSDRTLMGDTMVSAGPDPGGMPGGSSRGSGRRGGGGAVGGEDLARSQRIDVRLHSAAPIRMALARRALLAGSLTAEEADRFVNTHPAPGYIIVGITLPGSWNRGPLSDEQIESLRKKIYLELKKSKTRIYFERLVPPTRGQGRETYLYFSRTKEEKELFVPEEEEARFRANLDSRTRVGVNFKFKDMLFEGRLEI